MKAVWKYNIPIHTAAAMSNFPIEMPQGARFLGCGCKGYSGPEVLPKVIP